MTFRSPCAAATLKVERKKGGRKYNGREQEEGRTIKRLSKRKWKRERERGRQKSDGG